jgi:ABC-type phosphate/phosphonate transport system substrate-binding protein
VPKDIDALLAIGFGQVDAAFVSNAQFGQLAKINPRLTDNLHELGYAETLPFPMVYATEFASPADIEKLRTVMHTVNETGTGKRLTALLGYDGWNPVDPADTQPIPVPDRCNQSNEEKEGSS